MDFGNIGKALGGLMGKDMTKNLPLDKILQGVLNKAGIKMDPATVKSIVDSPIVQKLIEKAASAVMGAQESGKDVSKAVEAPLGKLAETILAKAPNTDVSKNDLVGHLKDELMGKLGF